jgi:hypothetical protein
MNGRRQLNSRWVKAGILLLLAVLSFMQAKSIASYLFACGFLCFAWCEAFRKYSPPLKLTFTMGKIYTSFRNPDYHPEPMILTIGMLGVALCLFSLIVGILNLVQVT